MSTISNYDSVYKLSGSVNDIYGDVQEIYDYIDVQNRKIKDLKDEQELLKEENHTLKEMIRGPNGIVEQLASLHELAKKGEIVIRGVIESISGIPATLKLKDGTAWKLNHFLFMNFHIWGWKQGDKVKITENESRFSTMGPYIIQNLSRGGTSSGYPLSDV